MKRSGPIVRTTRLSRSGPPKARKRKPSEFARIYGSKKRVEWIKGLPCVLRDAGLDCQGPIQNHHTENGGMGRKGDCHTIVPLCAFHHEFVHHYGRDLRADAAATHNAWLEHEGMRYL